MGDRDTTAVTQEPAEELYEQCLGEAADEGFNYWTLPRRLSKKG